MTAVATAGPLRPGPLPHVASNHRHTSPTERGAVGVVVGAEAAVGRIVAAVGGTVVVDLVVRDDVTVVVVAVAVAVVGSTVGVSSRISPGSRTR
jgi:hypothetical protein